jgi:hypothetical protein
VIAATIQTWRSVPPRRFAATSPKSVGGAASADGDAALSAGSFATAAALPTTNGLVRRFAWVGARALAILGMLVLVSSMAP